LPDESYIEQRRQEVLDGQKSWGYNLTDGDADRFFVEYVKPLRALESDGLFEGYDQLAVHGPGGDGQIIECYITGPVDYEH